MHKPSLAFSLLSLFAPPEKAAEIEGDLIEQSRSRGRAWKALHVLLTTVALFRAAVLRNFFFVVLLSYGTYELMAKTFFWGIRPLQVYLLFELALPGSVVRPLIYLLASSAGLFVGAALVRFLPRVGTQVAIGTIGLFFLRLAVLQEGFSVYQVLLYGAMPMLLGMFVANRWGLAHGAFESR